MVMNNKESNNSAFNIKINNVEIERVMEMKYLGMLITSNLKLESHVDYMCKKIAKKVGFLPESAST